MADHVPDPGKHRTLSYSYYANRVRGDRAVEEPAEAKVEAEPAKKHRCSASWARLIAKVFHADPLTCRRCGAKLKIVAYLHDTVAIKQILGGSGPGGGATRRLYERMTDPANNAFGFVHAEPVLDLLPGPTEPTCAGQFSRRSRCGARP
jgi:hypothetical protein